MDLADVIWSFFWTFLSVLLGGTITYRVSKRYYIKASRDLEDKVERLEELIRILGIYLERGGATGGKLEYDPDGLPKPFTQDIRAGSTSSEPKVFPPTVTQGDPPGEREAAGGDQGPR